LADDGSEALIIDPPYYNAVPYSDLSDFFYVWLKRMLGELHGGLFRGYISTVKKNSISVIDAIRSCT